MKLNKLFTTCLTFLLGGSLIFLSSGISPTKEVMAAATLNDVNVYFFHTPGCPECASERDFLLTKQTIYDNLSITEYDITIPAALALLDQAGTTFNVTDLRTPVTVVGGLLFSGFNDDVKAKLAKAIERYSLNEHVDIMAKIIASEEVLESDFDHTLDYDFYLPILGLVDVREISLAVIAIVLGFLDGINPCAMWVLIFLISLVLGSNDKKRIWLIGGIFLLTSGLFYFGLMMAWLKTIEFLVAKQAFQLIVGIFALGAGGYNIYSFIKAKMKKDDGCEVTSLPTKRKLIDRVKKIATTSSLPLALLGVATLAIIVNAIEIACSSGLPLLFTQILALNGITGTSSIWLVLLYILFFLIDDLIIFGIAVITLKVSPLSTKIGKYAHLVGGLIMLIIGILMIFFPEILLFSFL